MIKKKHTKNPAILTKKVRTKLTADTYRKFFQQKVCFGVKS